MSAITATPILTDGRRIIEIDYIQGTEREVERFATPAELWQRLQTAITLPEAAAPHLLEPFNLVSGKIPRYYQQITIHRVIEVILLGRTRILGTLATGSTTTEDVSTAGMWRSRHMSGCAMISCWCVMPEVCDLFHRIIMQATRDL